MLRVMSSVISWKEFYNESNIKKIQFLEPSSIDVKVIEGNVSSIYVSYLFIRFKIFCSWFWSSKISRSYEKLELNFSYRENNKKSKTQKSTANSGRPTVNILPIRYIFKTFDMILNWQPNEKIVKKKNPYFL